jgi:hypothetical protein
LPSATYSGSKKATVAGDVLHHPLIVAGELAQVVLVVGVGQEAHIEGEVLLAGRAVLEAEAHEREREPPGVLARQQLSRDTRAEHRGGHAGRVDHEVRTSAQRLQHLALGGHTVGDRAMRGERVAPTGLLVARGERLLRRLQEQHVMCDAKRLQVVHHRCKRLKIDTPPHVGDNRGPLHLGTLVHEQLHERADHLGREVVDAKVPRVLEHVHRGGLPGAREASDHDKILQTRLDRRSILGAWRHGPRYSHLNSIVPIAAGESVNVM